MNFDKEFLGILRENSKFIGLFIEFSAHRDFPSTLLSVIKIGFLSLSIRNTELMKKLLFNHKHTSPRAEFTFFMCSTFGAYNLVPIK